MFFPAKTRTMRGCRRAVPAKTRTMRGCRRAVPCSCWRVSRSPSRRSLTTNLSSHFNSLPSPHLQFALAAVPHHCLLGAGHGHCAITRRMASSKVKFTARQFSYENVYTKERHAGWPTQAVYAPAAISHVSAGPVTSPDRFTNKRQT